MEFLAGMTAVVLAIGMGLLACRAIMDAIFFLMIRGAIYQAVVATAGSSTDYPRTTGHGAAA